MSFALSASKYVSGNSTFQRVRLRTIKSFSSSSSSFSNTELSSLLFIPNDLAHKVVSILKPSVSLNVEDEYLETMRQNILTRGIKLNFDLSKLRNDFRHLEKLRSEVEMMKSEQVRQKTNFKLEKDEIQSTRNSFRKLMKMVSSLEESVLPQILRLPNRLDDHTPESEPMTLFSYNEPSSFDYEVVNHQILGRETKTIVWNSLVGPNAYYLTGELAWFERVALDYFRAQFQANKFTAFANPDFVKSIVVEGCGLSFTDPTVTFHMKRDEDANVHVATDLHLTGSASLLAFCAFHAKTSVKLSDLPLKYYASGRRYNPVPQATVERDGLFAVAHNTELSFFIVTQSQSEAEREHDAMVQILNSAFEKLNLHFRTQVVSARALDLSESKRIEIQMWSPARKAYFTVAKVSLHDDFISRRLLMLYRMEKRNKNFLHVVSGTAISIPTFLGCIMENLQKETLDFTLPIELQLRIDQLKKC